MTGRRVRAWVVALGAALSGGCFLFEGADDEAAAPKCDAPKVELGACGVLSPTSVPDSEFFGIAALPQEAGWNVYWTSEYAASPPYRLQLARASASGQPVSVATTLRGESEPFFLRGAVRLGARSVFQLNRKPLGSQTSRPSELYLIEGDGTTKSIDLEGFTLLSAAPVFLDQDTVAVVGAAGDGASTWLDVKVLSLGDGSVKASAKHATIGPAVPAVPEYSYVESIAALSVPSGILAAWVSTQRTEIRAALLDAAGQLLAGPVDVVQKSQGGLNRPELALLGDGRVAVTWTGAGEEEVRFRVLAADLAGVAAQAGTILNQTPDAQEHGRLAALPGGGALFVWSHESGGAYELRGVTVGPSLKRCSGAKEQRLSCDNASLPRASVVSARGNDVLIAWYDWSSKLVQTRFLRVP